MDTIHYYEARANTVKTEDIVLADNNRLLLQGLRGEGDAKVVDSMCIKDHYAGQHDNDTYVPEDKTDMGWFGYFIGASKDLTYLHLYEFCRDGQIDSVEPLFSGLTLNTSIKSLALTATNVVEGKLFTMLRPLFGNARSNLLDVYIGNCDVGGEAGRLLSLALEGCSRSLRTLNLSNTDISDEQMVHIITALSNKHHELRDLYLEGNRVGTKTCIALATLLRCAARGLEELKLDNNQICDEGLIELVPALSDQRCNLENLALVGNRSITAKGWRSLGTVLSTSNLVTIDIEQNTVDDEAVAHFTKCLAENHKLVRLGLNDNPSITEEGLRSISQLLCDASSVNRTFQSNHTLSQLLPWRGTYQVRALPQHGTYPHHGTHLWPNHALDQAYGGASTLLSLLELNGSSHDPKRVAVMKILKHHDDFDLGPLFDWEYSFLPLMIDWFEVASSYSFYFEANIEQRKLSSIYHFIRAMPLLYVELRLRKELEDMKYEDLSIEKEQLKLRLERSLLALKRKKVG